MKNSKVMKSLFSLFIFFGLLFAFVGCTTTVTKYKVIFQSEGKVVTSVVVEEGKTIPAEEVPANPEKEGYVFVGWFAGEVQFSESYVVEANVTFVAEFKKEPHTITFVVEGETVKEVVVEDGEAIDPLQVPADPEKKAHAFVGWFAGDVQFDEDAAVVASATYEAVFERTHFVVKFGEEEVLVAVGEGLSLADVKAPSQEGAFFAGWFAGEVQAVEGMAVEADMEFEAVFVTVEDFDGLWVSADGSWFEITAGSVYSAKFKGFGTSGTQFSFNVETGQLEYKVSLWNSVEYYYFALTSEGVSYIHNYYDAMEEDFITDVVELVAAFEESEFDGSYRADNSSIIEIKHGVVVSYAGTVTYSGKVTVTEEGLVIEYSTSGYSVYTVNAKFDEKGNMVVNGVIYVKNSTDFKYYYLSSNPTVYVFTVNGEQVITVKDGSASYYAEVEGELAEGEIVLVKYNEKELLIMITGATSYVVAGDERGTYVNGEDVLVLDGFGNAEVNGEPAEYALNANGIAVIGETGYKLNKEEGTFEVVAKDNFNNEKFILTSSSATAVYSLQFDGFGGALYTYASISAWFGTTYYYYYGSYEVKGNQIVVTGCDNNIYAAGTWSVEEDGKVLVKTTSSNTYVYVLEGATVTDHKEELNGVYGPKGEYVVTTGKIAINGVSYNLAYNYNGTLASFKIKCSENSKNKEVEEDVQIYLSEEGKLVVKTFHQDYDMDGYLEVDHVTTEEFAPYVPAELDAYVGTWVGNWYGEKVFVFNGDGTGTYDGSPITYRVSGSTLTFVAGDMEYTITGDPATGKLSAKFEQDYEDYGPFELVKQSDEPELDAFAGTWVGTVFGSKITCVINGDGTGKYGDAEITYTINGNKLTFEHNWETYSLVGDPSTGTLTLEYTYDYEDYSTTVTKQAESKGDGYQGTWTGKVGMNNQTFVFNGDGTGSWNGNSFSYTVNGNKVTFECGDYEFTVTGDPTTGKLSVSMEDVYEGYSFDGEITRG